MHTRFEEEGNFWFTKPQVLSTFPAGTADIWVLLSKCAPILFATLHAYLIVKTLRMPSILQAYDALPSETASSSPTLRQLDNQQSCEKTNSSVALPTSDFASRACPSQSWTVWKWEFAACFLVSAIPFIIFATLYPHGSQPLPQWPFKVSINSLLSIYALVLKASIGFILTSCIGQLQWTWFSEMRPLADMLHFDNATRGADGALGLIWRQRFRQPLTALGCVIMILAVAVDPFIQQLVRPVDCSVELSGAIVGATLSRANVFDGYGFEGNFSSTEFQKSVENGDRAVENVLYDAIFTLRQNPPWQCSTGNCTFQDTYGTIGICHSCRDISADVIFNATCSHPDSSYASQHPTSASDCPVNSSFTLESNITAGEYDRLATGTTMTVLSNGGVGAVQVADAVSDTEPSGSFSGAVSGLLFRFLIGALANTDGRIDWTTSDNSACDSEDSEGSWVCQGYGAATCSLKPCVQIYNATISAGVLEEHLVASSSDTAWGVINEPRGHALYLALVDSHCSPGSQTSSNQDSSVRSRWLPYNFNLTDADVELNEQGSMISFHLPDDIKSLLSSGCLYLISAGTIMNSVAPYLSGTVQTDAIGMMTSVSNPPMAGDSIIDSLSNFTGPEFIRSIYNWGHTDIERVESVFANISNSLTAYIRTHGGSTKAMGIIDLPRDVHGKVYHYATCLQVEWPWLSFPTSLAVLTTLFFLMVVAATKKQGASVWKASPLAWILRAEGPGNENSLSSTRTCKGMKERSEQLAVCLLDEDGKEPCILMADVKDPNLR